MKPINIIYMIRELLTLILVSAITLVALLIFSVYVITASLYEMIVKGIRSGFGRNITSVRRSLWKQGLGISAVKYWFT